MVVAVCIRMPEGTTNVVRWCEEKLRSVRPPGHAAEVTVSANLRRVASGGRYLLIKGKRSSEGRALF